MTDPWATVIAAVIGVFGTLIAKKFDLITYLFKREARKVSGGWEGESYWVISDPEKPFNPKIETREKRFQVKYTVAIKQMGRKISGTMTETETQNRDQKDNYKWTGKVNGDYLIYDCTSENPEHFLISSAMLFIHASGRKMSGYFIANGGASMPSRVWVGYAELFRVR